MYLQRVACRKYASSAGQQQLLSRASLRTAGTLVITLRLFPNTGLHARGLRSIGIVPERPLICRYAQSSHDHAGALHARVSRTGVILLIFTAYVRVVRNRMRPGERGPASSAARQCHVSMTLTWHGGRFELVIDSSGAALFGARGTPSHYPTIRRGSLPCTQETIPRRASQCVAQMAIVQGRTMREERPLFNVT